MGFWLTKLGPYWAPGDVLSETNTIVVRYRDHVPHASIVPYRVRTRDIWRDVEEQSSIDTYWLYTSFDYLS